MAQSRKSARKPNIFPTRLFKTKDDWAGWLEKNHRKSSGLWLRLAKKDSGLRSVTYKKALEVALCHGWIDGQKTPGKRTNVAAKVHAAFNNKHLVKN